MKRIIMAAVFILLFSGSVLAQVEPVKRAPSKSFRIGVSLLAASTAADAITTRQLLNRGGWENNPIFGKYPSPARQAGINLGFFAGQSALFYYTERNRHSFVRWTGRAYLGYVIFEHARMAACNAGIKVQSARAQNCF